MSTLLVNTLTGTSTAGSISVTGEGNSTTTNLQQGLAKAWSCIDGIGTINLRDSFNTASLTDNGTGDYTATYSSAMNNDDYAHPLGASVGSDFVFSSATTNIRIKPFSVGGNQADCDPETFAIFGDLA
tara:strand:+ start:1210 stop:1593 length:384 start_codon:yes stop_codon:yes gene_type:complete